MPADVRLVGVNERQILALPGRENRERITGHAIHRCPRQRGISDEQKRYRVELSEAERARLTAMLSGGKHAARKQPPLVPRRMLVVLLLGLGLGHGCYLPIQPLPPRLPAPCEAKIYNVEAPLRLPTPDSRRSKADAAGRSAPGADIGGDLHVIFARPNQ